MHFRLLNLCIAFFCCSGLWGQESTGIFSSLGVNEGLPSSSVYGIYQDSKGLIWTTGPEGLSCYDGNGVSNYNPADENAEFSSFFRQAPLEDADGNLWLTNESGICKFDKALKKIKIVSILRGISIHYYLDKEGWLWLHEDERGIIAYHTKTGSLKVFPYPFPLSQMNWNSFCGTTDGIEKIWFCQPRLYEFNTRTQKYRHIPGIEVNKISYGAGRLFLGNAEGLFVFNLQNDKVLHTIKLPGEKISELKDVVIGRNGTAWAGFYGQGIISVDTTGKLHAWHRQDNHDISTLSSDLVTTLMIDRSENLWIGTDGGGISRLNLKTVPFSRFPLSPQSYPLLNSYFVRGICKYIDGHILFGAYNNGLCGLNIANGKLHLYKNAPGNLKEINAITDARNGQFWIGTRTGLFLFNPGNGTFKHIAFSTPSTKPDPRDQGVSHILQLNEHEFLLATAWGPVIIRKAGNRWQASTKTPQALQRKINHMYAAADGMFYMAVAPGGLWLVRLEDNKFVLKDTFLTTHAIRYIHADEERRYLLWLATNKGVVCFNDSSHTYTTVSTRNGLLSNNTYGILEDERHRLWISSNGGLACYTKGNGYIRNYTFRNGLQSNEFNSGATYKSKDGVLFFGGVKGMNWFTAATVGADTTQPLTEITSVVADEKEIPQDHNHYIIPGYKNSFTITAAVLDYTNTEANLVRYKMEGWDNDWITSPAGTIRYTNMQPGTYTFRLVGIAGNALESIERNISITIETPVWQRSWFQFMVIALLVFIPATLVYQRRISRSKREVEQQRFLATERTRISQDLHDEIGAAITRIGLVSATIPQKNKMHQDIDKEVEMIAVTAREVAASMGEIVWALHTDYNTLESLLAYIREQAAGLIEPSGIKWQVCFPDIIPDVKLSGEARRNLLLITKEALNNAVKHARSAHIKLSCTIENGVVTFAVEDNGSGFDPGVSSNGNGIRNMRRRIQSVGGTISWHRLPHGTRVVYSVSVGH